ncbi:MAG: hypothetical protein JRH11_18885 [Deltaproteobacteria bacterium]|nr:hypothetical protein [Deltaproteobacteria bacterium]
MAHLTASITVNQPNRLDTIVYLHRATVFAGETRAQGLGTEASRYSGRAVDNEGNRTVTLLYDGIHPSKYPVPKSATA